MSDNQNSNSTQSIGNQNSFDFRLFLHYCYRFWYVFVVSIVIAYFIGNAYIRYAQPVYDVKAMVLIKDGGSYSSKSSGQMMEGLGMFKMSYNTYNEIEVIKSYNLVYAAVKGLDFDVSYFVGGKIKTGEIYQVAPFKVELDSTYEKQLLGTPVFLKLLTDSTYLLTIKRPASFKSKLMFWESSNDVLHQYKGAFGKNIKTPDFSVTIFPTVFFRDLKTAGGEYSFVINNLYSIAGNYASRLSVAQQSKFSSLVVLNVSGGIIEKEVNFLNKLSETYVQHGLDEKNEITVNTLRFIDDQLARISDSLKNSANQLEQFRNKENLVTVEGNTEKIYDELNDLEKQKAELEVRLKYYKYLFDYIDKNQNSKAVVAPSAVGIEDGLLNELVGEMYLLQSEQRSLSFSANEKNPTFGSLDIKIKNTRDALIENLTNLQKGTELYLKDNQERLDKVYAILYSLPKSQMYLATLQRQYAVNEKIYNLLLEKKTEAGIAKASNVSDNKVVNQATLSGKIYPNESEVSRNVFLFGLLLPLILLVSLTYMNSMIISKSMITRKTSLPILGTLGHYEGESQMAVLDSPKSSFAESMRALRINIQYLATEKKHKVIGVTSTISGEGKTFFALNLALSLIESGSKVVLLGADLRRPRLTSLLKLSSSKGITTFLIGKNTVEEIIVKKYVSDLDVIPAGPVPPNPSELIEKNKFGELIEYLGARYDYVLIDTSPVGLVSDYLLIAKHTDINLFMVRHSYTKISMIEDLELFRHENSIPNLYLVYNDVSYKSKKFGSGYRYGYGYGYGYGSSYGYSNEYGVENKKSFKKETRLKKVTNWMKKTPRKVQVYLSKLLTR